MRLWCVLWANTYMYIYIYICLYTYSQPYIITKVFTSITFRWMNTSIHIVPHTYPRLFLFEITRPFAFIWNKIPLAIGTRHLRINTSSFQSPIMQTPPKDLCEPLKATFPAYGQYDLSIKGAVWPLYIGSSSIVRCGSGCQCRNQYRSSYAIDGVLPVRVVHASI